MTTGPADGDASLTPDAAFDLLGNDTRVGILQALWDTFDSGKHDNAVSYSNLFEQVEIADSGNFSYHLERLVGPFVRSTARGYELKQSGINVIRGIVTGSVTEDPEFGPVGIDIRCPICNAPVEISYADEFMRVSCTQCEGRVNWNDECGLLFGALVPPVGLRNYSTDEAFRAAVVYTLHEIATFHDGVCSHCMSPVELTLNVCRNHDPGVGTLCPNCERYDMAEVWMVCSTCKRSIPPQASLVILNEPQVRTFYDEHTHGYRFASWETVERSFDVEEQLLSEDPIMVEFTITADDAALQLSLDRELNVRDVSV